MASLSPQQAAVEGAARGVRRAAAGRRRRVLLLLRDAAAGAARRRDRAELDAMRGAHRQGAGDGAAAAGVPQGKSPTSKRGSRRCKPILPEEKDAADLLRRIQTLAVQSNLTIRGFKPQAIATKRDCTRSGRSGSSSRARITTSASFLDRVSKFPRIINVGALAIKAAKDAPTRRHASASPARRRRSFSRSSRRACGRRTATKGSAAKKDAPTRKPNETPHRCSRCFWPLPGGAPRRRRRRRLAGSAPPAPGDGSGQPAGADARRRRRQLRLRARRPARSVRQPLNRGATGQKGGAGRRARRRASAGSSSTKSRSAASSRAAARWVAMIAGAERPHYTVRPGDRLMDGSVRTINAQTRRPAAGSQRSAVAREAARSAQVPSWRDQVMEHGRSARPLWRRSWPSTVWPRRVDGQWRRAARRKRRSCGLISSRASTARVARC